MEAIADGRGAALQEALQAQEGLLLAFPEAWARLGQSFTAEIAAGLNPLATGPLDTLGRHLYNQIMRAVRHGDQQIAEDAADLPVAVASGALSLGAHGIRNHRIVI